MTADMGLNMTFLTQYTVIMSKTGLTIHFSHSWESSILLLFTDQRTFLQDFNHHQDTSLTLKTELHEHLYYTRAINP